MRDIQFKVLVKVVVSNLENTTDFDKSLKRLEELK